MKKQLIHSIALVILMSPLAANALEWNDLNPVSWFGSGPCHGQKGSYGANHEHGFIADGASVSDEEQTQIPRGAQICNGASVADGAHIGPDAVLDGEVTVEAPAYVNARLRGSVNVSGYSRVETSGLICGRELLGGIDIRNSYIGGSVRMVGQGQINDAIVTRDRKYAEHIEICHTDARRSDRKEDTDGSFTEIGKDCDQDYRMVYAPQPAQMPANWSMQRGPQVSYDPSGRYKIIQSCRQIYNSANRTYICDTEYQRRQVTYYLSDRDWDNYGPDHIHGWHCHARDPHPQCLVPVKNSQFFYNPQTGQTEQIPDDVHQVTKVEIERNGSIDRSVISSYGGVVN